MSNKPQGLHYNDLQNFNRHAATDSKGLTSKNLPKLRELFRKIAILCADWRTRVSLMNDAQNQLARAGTALASHLPFSVMKSFSDAVVEYQELESGMARTRILQAIPTAHFLLPQPLLQRRAGKLHQPGSDWVSRAGRESVSVCERPADE